MEDISANELAALAARQEDRSHVRSSSAVIPKAHRNSAEFRDIYEITKGSRPWFVIDPQDGKIPPSFPRRQPADRQRASHWQFRQWAVQQPQDFSLWDRCITRGLPGSMLPGHLRQLVSDRAGGQASSRFATRWCMRHASSRSTKRAATRNRDSLRHGRRARPLGRRHARRRDDELQRRGAPTATPTPTRCGWWNASRAPHQTRSSGR